MRLLIAWTMLAVAPACGSPESDLTTPTTPTKLVEPPTTPTPSKALADNEGRCARTSAPLIPMTHQIEVTADLRRVMPLRKHGFSSYEISANRDGSPRRAGAALGPSIVGDTLRLSTHPRTCHDTNMGCSMSFWSSPGEVKLEDRVRAGACVSYALDLPLGIVVGIDTEMRTYVRGSDETFSKGPVVTTPVLDVVEVVEGRAFLQEHDGSLWTATWDHTSAPVMARVRGVVGRVLAVSDSINGLIYVHTESALYAVDAKTLVPQWHVDGEVWSARSDVTLENFVLTIERGPTSKAVLHHLDKTGKELRSVVVYEAANLIEAHLTKSSFQVRPDRYDPTFVVDITTR